MPDSISPQVVSTPTPEELQARRATLTGHRELCCAPPESCDATAELEAIDWLLDAPNPEEVR